MGSTALNRAAVRIRIVLAIGLSALVAEVWMGIKTVSSTLLLDGLHVGTDLVPIYILLGATLVLARAQIIPPGHDILYMRRRRYKGALINVWLLIGVIAISTIQAALRMSSPPRIDAGDALKWSGCSLAANIVQWLLLPHDHDALHKSVIAHIVTDMATSVAAIASNWIVSKTSWYWVDPVMSLTCCACLGYYVFTLFKEIRRTKPPDWHQ